MGSWWWFCWLCDTFGTQRVLLAILALLVERSMILAVWSTMEVRRAE